MYEYICDECGKHCEVIQKFTDKPLSTCPECSGRMRKVISQTSFILKGSGWYATDYASPERKKARESEEPSASKNQEKADGKKETANAESHAGSAATS
jgi:putative FmdB family regulatory protein